MPITQPTHIKSLNLDLTNYRTIPQNSEIEAVEAIVSINPDYFWALTESLLDSGYLPTENILIYKNSKENPSLIVKEGNRRVSALKLIHGLINYEHFQTPDYIIDKIKNIDQTWIDKNTYIPCTIYESNEVESLNKIQAIIHGKAEKSGRDNWESIARARHNREYNNAPEPALDLLEKYFIHGKNITSLQKQKWAGKYPISVLDEGIKKIAPRLKQESSVALAKNYPSIPYKTELDEIIYDIGMKIIGFTAFREMKEDVFYGIPSTSQKIILESEDKKQINNQTSSKKIEEVEKSKKIDSIDNKEEKKSTQQTNEKITKKTISIPINDPKQVKRALNSFTPKGENREKVATLLREMKLLKLEDHPFAFCFLLRSMFEISAKAYCIDHKEHGLQTTKGNNDRRLIDVLRDVTSHLTENNKNIEVTKKLHGAITELGKTDGILSVTSMNQLVHNPKFSPQTSDIVILFGNILPLLKAMNYN